MNRLPALIALFLLAACSKTDTSEKLSDAPRYITVNAEQPKYFAFSDGETYLPIGINMINPSRETPADSAFAEIDRWMKALSDNGGNYIRIWFSESFWDVEEKAGVYSEEKAKRIDRFVEMARKYKLRIKITLEHFRSITLAENNQPWATKFAYHRSQGGPLDSIAQYLSTDTGRNLFLKKVDYYKNRYGADTLFFGWELWNEMNAVRGPEDSTFFAWNELMLHEVKKRFPENLVMQSLGSFDTDKVRNVYRRMMELPGNEVAQVHRYLDQGAPLAVCQESMDIICSSAVEELLSYGLAKPVLLAETGAVEPRHAGPSKYYPADTAGILLHDILFAPFFSGAAGTGMSWHWESYVHKNNLWHHYRRFSEAVKGIDPAKEEFIPTVSNVRGTRIYKLSGKNTSLCWLRNSASNWKNELDRKIPVSPVVGLQLTAGELGVVNAEAIDVYDPWSDRWSKVNAINGSFTMPDFRRSLVVRVANTN